MLLHFQVGLDQMLLEEFLKSGVILGSISVHVDVRVSVEEPALGHRLCRVFALNLGQFSDRDFLLPFLGFAVKSVASDRSQQKLSNLFLS